MKNIICLKGREKEHVLVFWDKTRDEEIQKLFPFSINSLEESIKLFEESLKANAISYGKVIYYNGQYIGDVWCYCIDEIDEKMCMLSIVIFDKESWGKGIGSKVIEKFSDDVFGKYNIEKIGAFTYSFNIGSKRCLEKAGFSEVEVFVENGIESSYYEMFKY